MNGADHMNQDTLQQITQVDAARLTRDERAAIFHALDHLKVNNIEEEGGGGWYRGNKAQFIRNHKKAKAILEQLLQNP